MKTKAASSWFKRVYEVRALGQRVKHAHENKERKNGIIEGWAYKAKEEFFIKDGTYYTIFVRKTAGLDT